MISAQSAATDSVFDKGIRFFYEIFSQNFEYYFIFKINAAKYFAMTGSSWISWSITLQTHTNNSSSLLGKVDLSICFEKPGVFR